MSKAEKDADAAPDAAAIADDIAALKSDLAKLAGRLKADAAGNAAATAEQVLKRMTEQVEQQPLLSLLAAFGAGFVLSRLLSR